MKKVSIIFFVTLLLTISKSFSQSTTTPTDFWAGKWEITIMGTPNGDSKFNTTLVRKDGKLTGELATADPAQPKIPITGIEESADKIVIAFSAQGYDIAIDLTKVDDNNLKGGMMNGMFEAKGVRVK